MVRYEKSFRKLAGVMEGNGFEGHALLWGQTFYLNPLDPKQLSVGSKLVLLQNCSALTNLLPVLSSYARLLHVHLWNISTVPVIGNVIKNVKYLNELYLGSQVREKLYYVFSRVTRLRF